MKIRAFSLEKKGFVTRQPYPDDKRAHRVRLTGKAKEIGPANENSVRLLKKLGFKRINQGEFVLSRVEWQAQRRQAERIGLSEEEHMTNVIFDRARSFLYSNGRLLERLLFGVAFEGANPATVGRLISAYQNPDGGLGHALEPDLRCPESQPLFVEVGLSALREAGWRDHALCLSICDFLESVSDATGLVQIILESALSSPHASHWTSTGQSALNPTAGICGLLHYQGVEHPWLTRATRTCIDLLLQGPPPEAHTLLSAARLVEDLPDRQTAEKLAERIAAALPQASFFIPHAPVTGYGMTPLHFASFPGSRWRRFFTDEQIDGHLADLMSRQQADGGWPIGWDAPGPAAISEWRGRWTLDALSVLVDYGRLTITRSPGLY